MEDIGADEWATCSCGQQLSAKLSAKRTVVMCQEKDRLVEEYAAAAKALCERALTLRRLQGEELITARAEFNATRAECAEAKQALLRHKANHDCNALRQPTKRRAACGGAA
jgi:hypothetical protein